MKRLLILLSFAFIGCERCAECSHPSTTFPPYDVCEGDLGKNESFDEIIESVEGYGYTCNISK